MAADYSMTADLLAAHWISSPVSEIHGVLSGQLCADSARFDLQLTLSILDLEGGAAEVITNLLKMLAEDILVQLRDEIYGFQLLLPDEDKDFSQRLTALSHWCDGFNTGFAGAWIKDDADMETETREVLSDLSRIAEVDQEDEAINEKENEVDFMEIEEYVRMAAITVYLQYSSPDSNPDTLSLNVPGENIH